MSSANTTAGRTDADWMRQALRLARRGEGETAPNPPVGAVIVDNRGLVGRGYHRRAGEPHAEIEALSAATRSVRGTTMFVTLEPCATRGKTGACAAALIQAGISRVVIGVRDPNPVNGGKGINMLRRKGIQIEENCLNEECSALIEPFRVRIETGRPQLILKLGMTLDGRIADMHGQSKWITSPQSRESVQKIRRSADAVMVGIGTALADNPSLTARSGGTFHRRRIIVDSKARLPISAHVLQDGRASDTIVAVSRLAPASRVAALRSAGAEVWTLPARENQVSLKALMNRAGKAGMLRILCEGGAKLANSLMAQHLVNRLELFIAPRLLGSAGIPLLQGEGWTLKQAPNLKIIKSRRSGTDIWLTASPDSGHGAREA